MRGHQYSPFRTVLILRFICVIAGQQTDKDQEPHNLLSYAVIGGVVAISLFLLFLSWLIGSYKKSRLEVIYDGCGPSDFKVKYQFRVKTGSSLEVSPGNNPKQRGILTMDLCKLNGNFIARIKVPEETINKDKKKKKKKVDKNNTKVYKFCFASSKGEEDMDIGFVRLGYSKFAERIFVHYIEIKGLKGTSSIYRCFVNSKIGLLKPQHENLMRTAQTYPCKKNEGVTDQSDPSEYDLTFQEFAIFFMVASSLHCIITRFFLYDPSDDHVNYSKMAQSGAATGFLSLFITFLIIVVYRIAIKKNLGSKFVNGIRMTLLILLIIISFAVYVTAAILSIDFKNEHLKLWALAIGIGIILIIVIGLPAVIGFQYCCRCVTPEPEMDENETITKTFKSALGEPGPDSGLQPSNPQNSPKKVIVKSPVKMKHHP